MDLKVSVTQMAFAPEGVNRSGIVISDFLLFRVVTNTHTDVVVASSTNVYVGLWKLYDQIV